MKKEKLTRYFLRHKCRTRTALNLCLKFIVSEFGSVKFSTFILTQVFTLRSIIVRHIHQCMPDIRPKGQRKQSEKHQLSVFRFNISDFQLKILTCVVVGYADDPIVY